MTSQMYPGASAEEMRFFNHMQRMACSPQEAASIRRLLADYDATPCLAQVSCPTLVLHNPHDAMVPFEEGRLVAPSIAGTRLVLFESPNHVPLCGEAAFTPHRGACRVLYAGQDARCVRQRAASGGLELPVLPVTDHVHVLTQDQRRQVLADVRKARSPQLGRHRH